MNNIIDQITLDCLVNKEFYEKKIVNKNQHTISKKDKKFYRKRIINLSRDLLINNDNRETITTNMNILSAFDCYVKECINYFKIIDNNDIIQEDLNNISLRNEKVVSSDDLTNYNKTEDDKLLWCSIKPNNTIDNFVVKTIASPKEEIIYPKQKNINLKDPVLKTKGIKSRK